MRKSSLARWAAAGLLTISMLGLVGCKSMPLSMPELRKPDLSFMKPKMPKFGKPDMSKLAFWKSENLMPKNGLPKPPSLSFDPSPIQNSVASTGQAARAEVLEARDRVAGRLAELKKPLRKPYTDQLSSVEKLAESDTLDFDTGSIEAKQSEFVASGKTSLTKAQRDFQAALASSKKAVENSLAGKLDEKSTELASSRNNSSNDFSLPTGLAGKLKSAQSKVDQSLMAVNKSLYDANGKLASKAKSAKRDFDVAAVASAAEGPVSLFEQRLKEATKKNNTTKTTTTEEPQMAVAKTPAGLSVDSQKAASEIDQLKAQLAELKAQQQTFLAQQKEQLTAAAAPAKTVSTPVATKVTPNANEFVANLTARPSNNSASTANSFAGGSSANTFAPTTPAKPTYPQMYPSTAPLRSASSNNNILASAPRNVLRGNFSPVGVQNNYQPASNNAPAAPTQNSTESAYPSTNLGGFATRGNDFATTSAPTVTTPSTTPAATTTAASQASFQQLGNQDSNRPLVIQASTQTDNNAASHVDDVNIPAAVLQGSSSYAPGSVHPLQ